MKTSHEITVDEVTAALRTPQKTLLCASVGLKTNKKFYVVHSPAELNPYGFEVETVINGTPHRWNSNEPESMVKRYNELP